MKSFAQRLCVITIIFCLNNTRGMIPHHDQLLPPIPEEKTCCVCFQQLTLQAPSEAFTCTHHADLCKACGHNIATNSPNISLTCPLCRAPISTLLLTLNHIPSQNDIFITAGINDYLGMRFILNNVHCDINACDQHPQRPSLTVLQIAAFYNHTKIITELLQHPLINVNYQGPNKKTALYIAANRGNLEAIQSLLRHKDIEKFLGTTSCNNIEIAPYKIASINIKKLTLKRRKSIADETKLLTYRTIYELLRPHSCWEILWY